MFTKFLNLLSTAAFWFVYFCVCALTYTVFSVMIFASVPSTLVLIFSCFGLLWCCFAGTLPVLYLGFKRIGEWVSSFTTE